MMNNRDEYDKNRVLFNHVENLDSQIMDYYQAVAAGEEDDTKLNIGANRGILLAIAILIEEVLGPAVRFGNARSNPVYTGFVHNAIEVIPMARNDKHAYMVRVYTNLLNDAPPDFVEDSGAEGTD